jgi:hypothetical protein
VRSVHVLKDLTIDSARRCRAGGSLLAVAVVSAWLGGCASPSSIVLDRVANALAAQGQADEDDLSLARDAAPFYLKLSESVLRQMPDHVALAESVAAGFTQYAYAFVSFEADRLESSDARTARQLRERAARLYERAQMHALRTVRSRYPGWVDGLAVSADSAAQDARPPSFDAEFVSLAYWGASAWAARISLSKDQPEVVADLPAAVRLAQAAYAADPDHGSGALATLMGTLEAVRPGGMAERAQAYFARAQLAGDGRNAGVFVAMAESLAQPAGDRAAFEAWLHRALEIAQVQRNLSNLVMGQRAEWLLATVDDRF